LRASSKPIAYSISTLIIGDSHYFWAKQTFLDLLIWTSIPSFQLYPVVWRIMHLYRPIKVLTSELNDYAVVVGKAISCDSAHISNLLAS
jgi:hypothetical protein